MDSFFASILQVPVVPVLLVQEMTLTTIWGDSGHQDAGIWLVLTTSKMI